MSPARVGLVFAKELREALRDWRTLLMMTLVPLVIYPLAGLALVQSLAKKADGGGYPVSRVALGGRADETEAVRRLLRRDTKRFTVKPSGGAAEVTAGQLDAVVVVEGRPERAAEGKPAVPARAQIIYDQASGRSLTARDRLEEALNVRPPSCEPLYSLRTMMVGSSAKVGGKILAQGLPMLIIVMVMMGSLYPALDVTAGEHERGTLETLLSSPVDRIDLMIGKVLAVAAVAAASGVINLASLSLTLLGAVRLLDVKEVMAVPWGRVLATLLTVIPSALLFGAVMVAIGTMARRLKEAQILMTPVFILCATPIVIADIGEVQLRGAAMIVPVMNVTLLARDLLIGSARLGPALLVVVSTLAYSGFALSVAARLYDSERLLAADAGGGPGLRAWLRRLFGRGAPAPGRPGAGGPTPGHALALFGVAFVLLYFIFFPLQARALVPGLLLSEWVGLLGLVVLYARVTGQRVVEIVQLRRPTVRAVAGAVLIGLSAWAVIGMLVEWIAPAPKELVDHLRREIAPADGRRGLVVTLLLMALTPAICEEALFRGPILRGLASQLSPRAAALATGMLFGLFHFDIWRMLPTGLLGVVLSLIALRAGSIVPAMVAHFMNNACLITLAQLRLDDKMADLGRSAQAGMFGAAALVLATGAWLLRGPNQERRQGPG